MRVHRRETICNVLNCEAGELRRLSGSLDFDQAEALIDAIGGCHGKIVLSACGTSAQAAKKIAHTLCCVGCPAVFLSPSDALHGGLGVVGKEDMVILISKGGSTREINDMILPARQSGAKTVMVTENAEGEHARRCDLVLKIKVEEEPDRFHMLATASTLAVISVFDAISIILMSEREFTREHFARIHPGGDVGRRLAEEE